MRLSLWCVCVFVAACASMAETDDYMDDDVPAGMCEDTEGEACETGGQGDVCQGTTECGGDLVCAATFNGDIGTFECQAACIETMDESSWCLDDDACCDEDAICGPRGYCMIPGGVDTGSDTQSADESSGSETAELDTSSTDGGSDGATSTDTDAGSESTSGGER